MPLLHSCWVIKLILRIIFLTKYLPFIFELFTLVLVCFYTSITKHIYKSTKNRNNVYNFFQSVIIKQLTLVKNKICNTTRLHKNISVVTDVLVRRRILKIHSSRRNFSSFCQARRLPGSRSRRRWRSHVWRADRMEILAFPGDVAHLDRVLDTDTLDFVW